MNDKGKQSQRAAVVLRRVSSETLARSCKKNIRAQSTATSGIENKDGTRGGEVLF
jgi:hypothetical protein